MTTLAGIDLPFIPNCGSIILADDLYHAWPTPLRFIALQAAQHHPAQMRSEQLHLIPDHPARATPQRGPYLEHLKNHVSTLLDQLRPTLIHLHHFSFGLAQTLAQLRPQCPMLALCHGTGVLAALEHGVEHAGLRTILEATHTAVFPTASTRTKTRELLRGELPCASHIIPWGIPDHLLHQSLPQPMHDGVFKLLYAGRLTANKNAETLLRAMALVCRQHPRVQLTLCGPEPGLPHLRSQTDTLGTLRNHITFRPFLPRQRLWQTMLEHHALVIPTAVIEAFGLTAVEAQAHGLPVVYGNVDGLREVLGESALAFTPHSAEHLAEVLERLLTPSEYERFRRLSVSNAQRYPLSLTRERLVTLSQHVRDGHIAPDLV